MRNPPLYIMKHKIELHLKCITKSMQDYSTAQEYTSQEICAITSYIVYTNAQICRMYFNENMHQS
jgi:hypothetical protein